MADMSRSADATRTALIERHLDLPRRVARAIHPRCRRYVELEDLVSLGNAGLVEAAARFDPAAGSRFSTFAYYRVQGAIIDGIRRLTPLPRRKWQQLVALRAASSYLEERGADAAEASPSGDRAHTLAELHRAIAAIRTVYVLSLSDRPEDDLVSDEEGPAESLDRARLREILAAAIASLPEREREVVQHHYWSGRNLVEAGAELGVTKSAASRIHARALQRLRTSLSRSVRDVVDTTSSRPAPSSASGSPRRAGSTRERCSG